MPLRHFTASQRALWVLANFELRRPFAAWSNHFYSCGANRTSLYRQMLWTKLNQSNQIQNILGLSLVSQATIKSKDLSFVRVYASLWSFVHILVDIGFFFANGLYALLVSGSSLIKEKKWTSMVYNRSFHIYLFKRQDTVRMMIPLRLWIQSY